MTGEAAALPFGPTRGVSQASLRNRSVACFDTGGPPAFNHADRQNFANQPDRFIARRGKSG